MKLRFKDKRRFYSVVAGTLTVALVGTSIHLSSQQAMAKETFQGIKDIMDYNSMSNRFQIMELVPGTARYVVDVKDIDGTDPVALDLSLGEMGYYIEGDEPTEFDQNLKKLPSSEARYKYAEALLDADDSGVLTGGALYGITSQEDDDTKPLYYIPYEEDYNLTDDELISENSSGREWKELEYDVEPAEQRISRREMVSALDGRFLKTFSPKDEDGNLPDIGLLKNPFMDYILQRTISGNDPAVEGIPFRAGEGSGDFDPYFVSDPDEGGYDVVFEANEGAFGYRVSEALPAYADDTDVKDNTYIYEKYVSGNGTYYKYAGTFSQLKSILPNMPPEMEPGGEGDGEGTEPYKRPGLGDDGEAEEERVNSSEDEEINGSEEDPADEEEAGPSVEDGDEDNESEIVVEDGGSSDEGGSSEDGGSSDEGGSSEDGGSSDEGGSSDGSQDQDDKHPEDSDSSDDNEGSSDEKDKDDDHDGGSGEDSGKDESQARTISVRPRAAHDGEDDESAKDTISDFLEDAKGGHDDEEDEDEDDSEFEGMLDEDSDDEIVSAVEEEYVDGAGYEEDDGEPEEAEWEDIQDAVEEDVSMAEPPAEATGEYFIVYFTYDDTNPLSEGEYSYTAASWKADMLPSSNPYTLYASIADSVKDYVVPNYANAGSLKGQGEEDFLYIAKTPGSDDEGNTIYYGNFNLVKPDGSSDAKIYRVKGIKVFYRGVFGNSSWFSLYVFDRDEPYTETGEPSVYYNYSTVTPDKMANVEVGNLGLLYISAGNGLMLPEGYTLEHENEEGTLVPTKYEKGVNDITTSTMMAVLEAVVNYDLPVMVDYSLITDESLKGSNIQRLALLLNQEDVSIFYEENYLKADNVIDAMDIPTDYFLKDPKEHHVNKSVYVYNYTQSPLTMANGFFRTNSNEYLGTGFDEIRDLIDDENLLREVNGLKVSRIERDVNEAVAIKYIISYRGRRSAYVKQSITVLELQPRAVPEKESNKIEGHLYVEEVENPNDDSEIRYALKRKGKDRDTYILGKGNFRDDLPNEIKLVSMSTSEFVGRDADINSEYDMIFFGLSPYGFNRETDSDGNKRTVYNDKEMNGLLYSNMGDRVRVDGIPSGLMDKDLPLQGTDCNYSSGGSESDLRNVMRGPGNDLNKTKVAALRSYIKGGYPVVCDHNCFFGDDTDEFPDVYDSDDGRKGYIDQSSKVYEFLEMGRDSFGDGINTRNFFRLDSDNEVKSFTSMLNWSLNLPKPVLNVELADGKKPKEGYVRMIPSGGGQYMDFRIEIVDKRSTSDDDSYDLDLYLDWNNDGKYSDETELAGKSEYSITDSGGRDVNPGGGKYKLKIGKTYKVRYKYDLDAYGVRPIAWKLVAHLNRSDEMSVDEANARRSESIGCYFPRVDGDPQDINVLQILPDNPDSHHWDITEAGDTGDWQGGGGWATAMNRVADEFKINFTVVSDSDLIDHIYGNADKGIEADPNYISKFDLLILGFAYFYSALEDENYDDPLKKARIKAIAKKVQTWVENNNPTIIGPDTIGYINVPKAGVTAVDDDGNEFTEISRYGGTAISQMNSSSHLAGLNTWFGFHTTKRLRCLAGMDRYGITQRKDPIYGEDQVSGTGNMGDILRKNSQVDYSDVAGEDVNTFGVEYGFRPNSDHKLAREFDGFTDSVLNSYKTGDTSYAYGKYYSGVAEQDKISTDGSLIGLMDWTGVDKAKADKTLMNIGTMTLYPNTLSERQQGGDNMEVPTLALDLVGDGYDGSKDEQPDVTVWYTYVDGNAYMRQNAGDARQLYFLYSRGNLTFVNFLTSVHPDVYDFMINVIINTAIPLPKKAVINFYDGKTTDSLQTRRKYVPYEKMGDSSTGLDGDNIELYFKSSRFTEGKTDLLTNFYVETGDSDNYDLKDEGRYLKKIEHPVVTKVDSSEQLPERTVVVRKSTGGSDTFTGVALDDSSQDFMYTLHLPVTVFRDYFGGLEQENVKIWVIQTDIPGRSSGGGVDRESNVTRDYTVLLKTELFSLD